MKIAAEYPEWTAADVMECLKAGSKDKVFAQIKATLAAKKTPKKGDNLNPMHLLDSLINNKANAEEKELVLLGMEVLKDATGKNGAAHHTRVKYETAAKKFHKEDKKAAKAA